MPPDPLVGSRLRVRISAHTRKSAPRALPISARNTTQRSSSLVTNHYFHGFRGFC